MNTQCAVKGLAAAMLVTFGLISNAGAMSLIVNDDIDPKVGVAERCTSRLPGKRCAFRDALAASDAMPGVQTITFDVNKPIFLSQQLTAVEPVIIDGGENKVRLRVSQRYNIVELVDRFEPYDTVLAVQPEYRSQNGPTRPMLELRGSGSVVRNLKIDGSITPHGGDVGVARIDYDSDYSTDFFLYTLESSAVGSEPASSVSAPRFVSSRWPIAGGVSAVFQSGIGGAIEISNNEFSGHNTNAISVENFHVAKVISNNIQLGLAGLPSGSGSGVFAVFGVDLEVTGNKISGYREGVHSLYVSGLRIEGNEVDGNEKGIFVEQTDASFGSNRIASNVASNNLDSGLAVNIAAEIAIENNQITSNGRFGVNLTGAGYLGLVNNQVSSNGTDQSFDGGIRIAEESGALSVTGNTIEANSGFGIAIDNSIYNSVNQNTVTNNGGAGIVLVNNSTGNTVQANTVQENLIGILSASLGEFFPSFNQILNNTLFGNIALDAADYDPQCNDFWQGNNVTRINPEAVGCIQ